MNISIFPISENEYIETIKLIENIFDEKNSALAKFQLENYFFHPFYVTGKIYLIKNSTKNIGITGYYNIEPKKEIYGLRHHGILPKFRKKGISKQSLQLLIQMMNNPLNLNPKSLIEILPKSIQETENHFKKLGFQRISEFKYKFPDISSKNDIVLELKI